MRTQLFRTSPVLINGASVLVAQKDIDGVSPLTLFLENMDIAASLRTKFGSKNANVRFVAVTPGADGNNISVEITAAVNQAFSVVVDNQLPYASTVQVNLRCDGDGRPNQLVSDVIDLLNADLDFAAMLRAVLAQGSDGSAAMELVSATHAMTSTALAGGSDATATGAAVVQYSPNGAPDFGGPWVTHSAAGTALSTVAPNTVKAYTLVDTPARGVRLEVSTGGADTNVVATAQSEKKGV